MRSIAARIIVVAALCAVTGLAAGRLQAARERPYDVTVVPPSSVARAVSLGHPTLVANLYWLRAVQYIGDSRANERGWEQLYPLLDLITDLDPRHGYAYQVGGVILGTARRVSESNALLEKGIRAVPSRYMLAKLRAFNAFYYDDDFALASRFMEIAARAPGAPPHLAHEALAFSVKGNRAEAAIPFLTRLIEDAADPETRKTLERELKQAYLERDARALDDALERYRELHFFSPLTLGILVVERFIERIPPDPFGGEFVIGRDGRAHSSVNDFRFGRPTRATLREPGLRAEQRDHPGARTKL